jgi:hypothetical protein
MHMLRAHRRLSVVLDRSEVLAGSVCFTGFLWCFLSSICIPKIYGLMMVLASLFLYLM